MNVGTLRNALLRRTVLLVGFTLAGCASPEDGRARGGGAGGDGGNYREKPIHAPSKLDGSKVVPAQKSPAEPA